MSHLEENYRDIKERIRLACLRSGRKEEEVTLLAVSKTKPLEMIRELAACGQTEFGENHVQEIVEKYDAFPDVHYHMIGHLQKNKVKNAVARSPLIHSVDTKALAKVISDKALAVGKVQDILIEINGGNEESKYGFTFEEVRDCIPEIAALPGVHICGLMCVAPNVADPNENRPVFRRMRELAVDIDAEKLDNVDMKILSMGMTNDFEVAVEEGATIVRVGTALFGKREYRGE